METYEAIIKRASVREYTDKPIGKEILEKLVDAGRRAPSARAVEPWEFIVVTDKKILQQIGQAAASGSFIKDAAACLVIFCQDTKYYLEDGCAATENILLLAADLGLGACWVAGDKKPYAPAISELLKVPAAYKLISLISLGWPKQETRQSKQRALSAVIHWEGFNRAYKKV
ncbi:MAG: nitroreductase family protein [Candidatus Omnitrophota bacterium]